MRDNKTKENDSIKNNENTNNDYDESFYENEESDIEEDEMLFNPEDIENLGIDFNDESTVENEIYNSEDFSKLKKVKQKEDKHRKLKEKEDKGESEALTKFFVVLFSTILIAISLYGVVYFATKTGEQLSTTDNIITRQYE